MTSIFAELVYIIIKLQAEAQPLGARFHCCVEDSLVALCYFLICGRVVVSLTYSLFLFYFIHVI